MHTIDARNIPCPQPVLLCRTTIQTQQPSQIRVIVDNEAAMENVNRFLSQQGYQVRTTQEGHEYVLIAHAAHQDTSSATTQKLSAASVKERKETEKVVVFITTETLGRGDDTLGIGLMTTFLETLPEFEKRLWRIILLNGGVKLATYTEGENKALMALQKLAQEGVSIFVCGTCLNHYGLLEQKAVGETSNMLDIVTSLDVADKIIRP